MKIVKYVIAAALAFFLVFNNILNGAQQDAVVAAFTNHQMAGRLLQTLGNSGMLYLVLRS
jgi:hypothetical protein